MSAAPIAPGNLVKVVREGSHLNGMIVRVKSVSGNDVAVQVVVSHWLPIGALQKVAEQ